jgi:8-oxo-dGTP pyrophosphatase MutT (NUDIX family)
MSELTHAGGIVVLFEEGSPRYLMITSKKDPQRWVFPKGHINPGETSAIAAEREVSEEAGVEAIILESVGSTEFTKKDGRCCCVEFFLMRYERATVKREDRNRRWCSYEEALRLLSLDYAVDLLRRSHVIATKFIDKPEPFSSSVSQQ